MRRLATTTTGDFQAAGVASLIVDSDIMPFAGDEDRPGVPPIAPAPRSRIASQPFRTGGKQGRLRFTRQARSLTSSGWAAMCRHIPNRCWFNRLIAGVYFRRVHGRKPLPLSAQGGTINDFIFHRMTGGRWTDQERRCVDKISAKAEAIRLAPTLRVPNIRATIEMDDVRTATDLYHRLSEFAGEDLVAKPAHGSGATLWLSQGLTRADAGELFAAWRQDYFWQMRETQYAGLPRRVVIEQAVRKADGSPPDDYKFMCVHGRPVLAQVDHDRFGSNPVRRLYRLPEFELYYPDDDKLASIGWQLAEPAVLAEMTRLASELAQPFDYVRIDLLLADFPYFGEFTFSQGASLGRYPAARTCQGQVPSYDRYLLDQLHRLAAGPD
jgi:hypothetical protein